MVNFGNPLEARVPNQQFSYSDHNAVALELRLKQEAKLHEKHYKDDYFHDTIVQTMRVCEEATVTISRSKTMYLTLGGLLFMFLIGTVGFWPNNVIYDVIKLLMSALCFYLIIMGTLWNRIEMNSLKAGLSALENFNKRKSEIHAD